MRASILPFSIPSPIPLLIQQAFSWVNCLECRDMLNSAPTQGAYEILEETDTS